MTKLKTAVLLVCLCAAPAPASVAAPAVVAPQPAGGTAQASPQAVADSQKSAIAALARLATPPSVPMVHPWRSVTCGPLLWKRLVARDAALSNRGVKADLGKAGQPQIEARSFSPAHEDDWLYKSPALQQLAKTFAAGKPRVASAEERAAFAALAPFVVGAGPLTVVDAMGESLLVYPDAAAGLLWIDLSAGVKTEAKPAVAASTATAAAAPAASGSTPETIYPVSDLRDPFLALAAGGAKAVTAAPAQCSPEDFSVHNLSLRGLMKDHAVEYAVFGWDACGQTFVLRHGKLYDAKGRAVRGVTGGLNLKQRSAHLKSDEGDVQIFRMGETAEQSEQPQSARPAAPGQ